MTKRRSRWAVLVVACLAGLALSSEPAASRATDHVVIIMLDGTRADALRLAHAPVIAGLAASGTRYLQARTIYPSQTRVAFVSLPTGAYGGSHGIVGGDAYKDAEWRTVSLGLDSDPVPAQRLVARRTMFEEASTDGITSLYAAMKGYELVGARGATWTINGNHTLDRIAYPTRYAPAVEGSRALAVGYKQLLSRQLLDQALDTIREKRPNLIVINLGSADYAAHAFGPSAPEYQQTIEFLDGLVGELVKTFDELGLRERTTFIVSSDHGFTNGDGHTLAATSSPEGLQVPSLKALGIEHFVTNTGGTSMGIYIREKSRIGEAVEALRREPWTDSIYCEAPAANCDRTLASLHAYFAGRSPDLMVDLDDEASVNRPYWGNHGSLRDIDMQIPLILSGAGIRHGAVGGKAELVDVAPTVLRLLGIAPESMQFDGRVLEDALIDGRR